MSCGIDQKGQECHAEQRQHQASPADKAHGRVLHCEALAVNEVVFRDFVFDVHRTFDVFKKTSRLQLPGVPPFPAALLTKLMVLPSSHRDYRAGSMKPVLPLYLTEHSFLGELLD